MKHPFGIILLASLLGFGNTNWQAVAAEPAPAPNVPLEALQDFVTVYERVRTEHVDPHTDEELLKLALQGLMLKLDPYSVFLDAAATQALAEATTGSYVGIGLEIEPAGHHILVITPIDGSPAQQAGVQPGDWVTHIDQHSVKGLDHTAISNLISGPKGSEVTLKILRQGQELKFTMQRAQIDMPSVRSELMADQIGYLRISQFQERTAIELVRHMQNLRQNGAQAWLLDLRNNPGGLITTGVAVADAFLHQGTIVSTRARHEYGNMVYEADATDPSKKLPTLVLINRGSASAAEIVAAALQENRRAKLAGQTSFGKGSVQSVISLDEQRSIKLTTAYYYTPAGNNLNNNGIVPDHKLSDTKTGEDTLQKAIALLQNQL
ncbi:MAG: S41 family peptidase [Gammaproteobacteria bacterium]|jgi:carboxyl-terminal processing protease|nr:S41 family peptidase [Gammaproteobacteria bacterium]